MGRWDYTAEPLGVLQLKTNSKTGKAKGVTKSGQKKIVRAWCHRRQRTMYVGTFPDTPQAQAALASAEDYGVGNIPTPKARKARTKKTGTHVAIPHSPCLALRLRARGSCVCSPVADQNSPRATQLDLDSNVFAEAIDQLWQSSMVGGEHAELASDAINDAVLAADAAPPVRGQGGLPVLRRTSQHTQRRARPLPASLRRAREGISV